MLTAHQPLPVNMCLMRLSHSQWTPSKSSSLPKNYDWPGSMLISRTLQRWLQQIHYGSRESWPNTKAMTGLPANHISICISFLSLCTLVISGLSHDGRFSGKRDDLAKAFNASWAFVKDVSRLSPAVPGCPGCCPRQGGIKRLGGGRHIQPTSLIIAPLKRRT